MEGLKRKFYRWNIPVTDGDLLSLIASHNTPLMRNSAFTPAAKRASPWLYCFMAIG